jgi:prephenate dehydratase
MPVIAIQGESGSFSHEAAMRLYPDARILPCAVSPMAFDAVVSGAADAAVLPIENSLAGSVLEHYDLLLERPVTIEREMLLRIEHNLIALPGARLEEIEQVLSHPVALAQCRQFFAAHPAVRATPSYDTAGSVKLVMAGGQRSAAAIAPARAASEYGAEILARNIEDNAQNYTRFLVVKPAGTAQFAGADKGSLAFTLPNRPGALVGALEVLATLGANLTRLESRPVLGQPWHYVFYADYQFGKQETADAALAGLKSICPSVKELGRFPSATSLSSI